MGDLGNNSLKLWKNESDVALRTVDGTKGGKMRPKSICLIIEQIVASWNEMRKKNIGWVQQLVSKPLKVVTLSLVLLKSLSEDESSEDVDDNLLLEVSAVSKTVSVVAA